MTTLMLTRGIPGSGKSTWAVQWVNEQPQWRSRVNRDDLRFSMFGAYVLDRMREDSVTLAQQGQVRALLSAGISVVVDDTNLRSQTIREWQKIAAETGAEVDFEDFPIDVDEAIKRNAKRAADGGRDVPEAVIRSFYDRYMRKGKFPEIPSELPEVAVWEPYVPVEFGPDAILVDLDGTLAEMGDRNPYDWARVGEDALIENVANVVKMVYASGVEVIFMSGREDVCRSETLNWLLDHGFVVDHLHMRAKDDHRKDNIVKYELFNRHIRDTFNIIGVFDDRKQVVKMWRDIGLTVFQVDWGEF